MGDIQATPRNKILGLLADGVGGLNSYLTRPRPGSLVEGEFNALASLTGLDPIAKSLNELSYGGSLGTGSGMTYKPKADTMDAALSVAPLAGPAARLAGKGAVAGAEALAPKIGDALDAYMNSTGMQLNAAAPGKAIRMRDSTVRNPKRMAYPSIYADPRELVAEATSRVAPENPMLKRLFGVTRDDLWQIGEQGGRQGNLTDIPFKTAANPKGAAHVEDITGKKNTGRLQDLMVEAMNSPSLHRPMSSWYVTDPLYQHMERLWGPDRAVQEFNQFNALTGMSSPGSEVLTELNRGTGANMLAHQGRFDDFMKYGGVSEGKRGANYPDDMRSIMGHAYHKTSQAPAMETYLSNGGTVDMGSAKVPSYIQASGTPETGFQTNWPVVDAHKARILGLPDVRPAKFKKGEEVVPNASASVPEVLSLKDWFEQNIANATGHSSVGAQGTLWGAGSGATGVTSPIGAPKLELLAQQIEKASRRMGVTPEQARDMILTGKAHAGMADPELLGAIGAGVSGGLLANQYFSDGQ